MDEPTRPAESDSRRDPVGCAAWAMRDRLVRLAYRFLWNREDAEDVAQEAMFIAHQRGAGLRDKNRWWSWLARIVVNRCHERGRRRLRRDRHWDALCVEAGHRRVGCRANDGSELKEAVRRSLSVLPRRQHEVIVLRHLHAMSYQDIADTLGISPATARVHARAGREALREALLERSPDLFSRMDVKNTDHERKP